MLLKQCKFFQGFCGQIADKYVEYDTAIIIIDLILLKLVAFRHILLNTKFKVGIHLFTYLIQIPLFSLYLIKYIRPIYI